MVRKNLPIIVLVVSIFSLALIVAIHWPQIVDYRTPKFDNYGPVLGTKEHQAPVSMMFKCTVSSSYINCDTIFFPAGITMVKPVDVEWETLVSGQRYGRLIDSFDIKKEAECDSWTWLIGPPLEIPNQQKVANVNLAVYCPDGKYDWFIPVGLSIQGGAILGP